MTPLRLGTRQSTLAQAQAGWVADYLRAAVPGLSVELVLITTSGDRRRLASSSKKKALPGGLKALFTKEIEDALLKKRIDIAVHSLKDMASELPKGLKLAALPTREDPHDVWISRNGTAFKDLKKGARIATGAVRRQAQLLHWRPDLKIVPLRGNVDTRLSKLKEGSFDGMVLALAGLKRLGWEGEATEVFPLERMLPAVGQGALAIETRAHDPAVEKLVKSIDDIPSHQSALAERSFLLMLGGSCQTPIAAYAQATDGHLSISGLVVGPAGNPYFHAAAEGPAEQAETIGRRLAQTLLARGADKILKL